MLSQLAQRTFFNINIFTPEYLFGTYPATVVLALLFVSLIVATYFIGLDLKHKNTLLTIFMMVSAPFLWAFFFQLSSTLPADLKASSAPTDENLRDSFCQMDKTQNLGGIYCAMGHFLIEVTDLVPADAPTKLLFDQGLSSYSNHYLYGRLNLVNDINQAKYLVIFSPRRNWSLSESGNFYLDQDGQMQDYGRWKQVATYHPQILILERL